MINAVVQCPVKMRPFPNDTEIRCEILARIEHTRHTGDLRDYAYPGSVTTMSWDDGDRRIFTGEWAKCSSPGCVLPAGHIRNHETDFRDFIEAEQ